ncbi:hypothetical protein ACOMHN_018407 [Nucella lapillus]
MAEISKEFPRDSPQIVKAAETNNSADTSADLSLQDADTVPTNHGPSSAEVDQPFQDLPAAGSSFMLDDGETTFIADMADHGGFRESTRRFDRLDSNMFRETGGLDVSEITVGENSVFVPAPRSGAGGSVGTVPSGLTRGPGGKTAAGLVQVPSRPAPKHGTLKRAPELNFHGQSNNLTLLFDNQDGATMDLTGMDTTTTRDFTFNHSPEFSARNFLDKMRRGRKECEGGPDREQHQHTIMFSEADGNAMELTQNLTQHNVTAEFKLVPQAFKPQVAVQEPGAISGGFGASNSDCLNADDAPKVSAKSFLASLQNRGSTSTGVTAPESAALNMLGRPMQGPSRKVEENEPREDGDVTCQLASKPMSQVGSMSGMGEDEDNVENEDEGTEVMELTSCTDNTYKMPPHASTSFSAQQGANTSGQTRNALMDITGRHSISPPTVPQPETGNVILSKETSINHDLFIDQENLDSNCKAAVVGNRQSNKVPLMPLQTDRSAPSVSLPVTCPINVPVCMTGGQPPLSSADAVNRSVHFAAGDDMEITQDLGSSVQDQHCNAHNFSQGVPSQSFSMKTTHAGNQQNTSGIHSAHEKFTGYGKNESKDLSFAAKRETNSRKDSHEKSVVFTTDNAAADMSLKCVTFPNTVPQERSSMNRTVTFDKGDTVTDTSLASASVDKGHSHKTVLYGEETMANMSLTCTNLPTSVAVDSTATNRSVLFKTEATAADMSMTCADLQLTEKSIHLKRDNINMPTKRSMTGAEVSLTQPNSTDGQTRDKIPTEGQQVSEETTVCAKEATAANISLTCADLTLTQTERSEQNEAPCCEENQTITFKTNRRGMQKRNASASKENHPWEKSIVFSREASAANMSLTCANLPAVETMEQKKAVYLEDSQTVPSRSDITQSRNMVPSEKYDAAEKSIVFSQEATAANMSLTCCNLPAPQAAESQLAMGHSEGGKQGEDRTEVFCHDRSTAHMDLTCVSPVARSQHGMNESTKRQESLIPSHDKTVTKLNHTLPSLERSADAPNSCASAEAVPYQSREHVVDETEKEAPEEPFKNEPTTLMDITRVLEDLGKKMDQAEASEETGPEGALTQDEHMQQDPSPSERPKPDNVNTPSSRKLQLSRATPETRMADVAYSCTETGQSSAFAGSSLKRSLLTSNRENEPVSKTMRLSSETESDSQSDCSPAASSKDSDIFREPEPRVLEVEKKVGEADSLSAGKQIADTFPPLLRNSSSSSSSSGSNSSCSLDIASETMPVFGTSASNTSWASSSAISMSALHNATGSFLAAGRSFVEKQERGEEEGSFVETCERLGISQSDLKGWVCRRSSVATIREVSCDTVEEQLNSASVVKEECESKMDFISAMEVLQQREEASREELEKTVMGHIGQAGLVSEAQQFQSVRQQLRGLLFASRKHAQVGWKTHKADRLHTLALRMEKHGMAVSTDLEDQMTSIEHMTILRNNVDNGIGRLQSEVESLQQKVGARNRGSRQDPQQQQQLHQQQSDLTSLQEQVSEAKQVVSQMGQREQDLLLEQERVRQRWQRDEERQRQLADAHLTLAALHCVHCWRTVCVDEHRVSLLLLHDAVLLSIDLSGASPDHRVTDVTVTSRITDGTEPWAVLATDLVVDSLSACRQHLLDTFPCRQHLPALLDEVSGRYRYYITGMGILRKFAEIRESKINLREKEKKNSPRKKS